MRTYIEAVNEEYDWITSTINELWEEAYESGKVLDSEPRELYNHAVFLRRQLKPNGEFSKDFFRIMEELKGVTGDYMRAIRS